MRGWLVHVKRTATAVLGLAAAATVVVAVPATASAKSVSDDTSFTVQQSGTVGTAGTGKGPTYQVNAWEW